MNLPTYTRVQRDSIAAALKRARPHLAESDCSDGDQSEFLCHAIKIGNTVLTGWTSSCMTPGANMAQYVIADRIKPHNTFSNWLWANVEKDTPGREAIINDEHGCQMQAHRRAWLEMLIAEFEVSP